MKLDDLQLGQHLRDLESPSQLPDLLMRIPDGSSVTVRKPLNRLTRPIMGFSIAASLIFVLFVMRPWAGERAPEGADRPVIANRHEPADPTITAELQGIRDRNQVLNDLIVQMELRQLRSRLNKLHLAEPAPGYDGRQRASMILALADQQGLQWGASPQYVEAQMQQLLISFPGTQGAQWAQQYLNQ